MGWLYSQPETTVTAALDALCTPKMASASAAHRLGDALIGRNGLWLRPIRYGVMVLRYVIAVTLPLPVTK